MLRNRERFPYKQILGAAKRNERGKIIEVCVIDDETSPSYAMVLGQGGLTAQPHDQCENCNCDKQWNIKRSYLEEVAKDPDSYIENPAKLDWDWMC